MHSYRVSAIRRALVASLLVPLVAIALTLARSTGVEVPDHRPVGLLLFALAGLPTTVYMFSAATGQPMGELERGWGFIPTWQRGLSAMVAMVCGLTAGAAFVLIVLSMIALDAQAAAQLLQDGLGTGDNG